MSKKKLVVKTSPDVQEELSTPVEDKVVITDVNALINVHLTPELNSIVKATVAFYPDEVVKIAHYVNSLAPHNLVKTLAVFYPIPSEE